MSRNMSEKSRTALEQDSPFQLDRRESRRDMEAIGRNIGETKKNIAQRRMKQGRCPTCGTKTHKVGFFGKKTALTVEGEALYGRCLICEPVEGYVKRPHEHHNHYHGDPYDGPRHLAPGTELLLSDDSSLVSGLTMEPGLIAGARNWDGYGEGEEYLSRWDEEEEEEEKSHKRPEPSVASSDNDRPAAPSRRRSSDLKHLSVVDESNDGMGRMRNELDHESISKHSTSRDRSKHRRQSYREEDEEEVKLPEQIFEEQMARRAISPALQARTPPRALTPPNDRDSGSSPKPSTPDSRLPKYRGVEFNMNMIPSEEAKNEVESPFQVHSPQWRSNDPAFACNSRDSESPWRGERDSPPVMAQTSRDSSSEFHRSLPEIPEAPTSAFQTSMSEFSSYMDSNHSHSVNHRTRNFTADPNLSFSPGTSPVVKSNVKQKKASDSPVQTAYAEISDGFGRSSPSYGRSAHARKTDDSPGEPPLVRSRGRPDDDDAPCDPQASRPPAGRRKNDLAEVREAVDQLSLSPLSQKQPITNGGKTVDSPGKGARVEQIDDICNILHCLNMDTQTTHMREKAFLSLARLVWNSGEKAKSIIAKYKGIQTLVRSMWAEIDNVLVQKAAVHFLFALAASVDGSKDNDVLVGDSAEGAVDALLISMQTHISVESIQRDGCGTLCSLASAASNNKSIDDGTNSGALMIVVQAMDAHRTSLVLQEWGVRALFAQCAFSVNADSNKRSLVRGEFERSVLLHALDVCKSEVTAAEWVFRLFYCLTSHDDVSGTLSESPALLYLILDIVQSYHRKSNSAGLVAAAFGIIGNLSLEEGLKHDVVGLGLTSIVIESMQYHRNHAGLNTEASALLANLAADPASKENILRAGGISAIVNSIIICRGNKEVIEEGLRALVVLSIGFDDAKAGLARSEILDNLFKAIGEHHQAAPLQEFACSLLATLCSRMSYERVVVSCGGVELLIKAMNAHPSERKLQEAACIAFRNIACVEDDTSELLRGEAVPTLIKAMSLHEDSEIIQRNACGAFWSIVFKATEDAESIVRCEALNYIVKAMQSHLESGALQEVACGAIWSLVEESEDRKRSVFNNGGIEAVTCALVMHPNQETTLEMACGVLSNLSVIASFARAIAEAQGVSGIVEAMRNHSSSVGVLEFGSLTLRNIVVADPGYADEAVQAISIIINGMKNYPDAVAFQKEACYALWVMAALSDICKSRIQALDGLTALINTLDYNSCVADVQEAARGAFNQLASNAVI